MKFINSWGTIGGIRIAFFAVLFINSLNSFGQIGIPSSTAVTENFDVMAASATASLPTSWKMSSAGAAAPTYAAAGNFTTVTQQFSSGSPATGGRYNWGNGTTTTDRAAGFMTSAGYANPNSIMTYFQNTSGSTISDLLISFDYERYRINSAACAITFYTSTDGTTWTPQTAGDSGAFSTGASAYNYSTGTVVSKSFTLSAVNIASLGSLYLRWNFNTTGSNSQGVGLDNFSLTAAFVPGCTAPSIQAQDITFSSVTSTTTNVNWTNGNGAGRVVKMNTSNSFTTLSAGVLPAASTTWANSGEQVVYAGTGSGPITITGLTASTTYYYRVYEYCTTGYVYQSATATNNPNSQVTAVPTSPTLIAGTLAAFGSKCISTINGPNSFTLSGTSLDNTAIAIAALPGYSYATTSGGTYTSTLSLTTAGTDYTYGSGTLSGCTIYVKFSPIAVATYGGAINISGGGISPTINVTASATDIGINTAPTISTPTSTSIGTTTATLGGTIVTTGCSNVTERGIYWSTTPGIVTFGGGTNVPETAGAPFTTGAFTEAITGLPSGTTVYYAAYAINSAGTVYTTQSSFVTLKSEPTNQSTLFACGLTTSTSIPLTWTDASAGILPDGYIIKWSSTSYAAIVDPTDGVAETNGAGIVNVAQGLHAATASGLTNSTTYYFKIWSYTNSGSNINYNLISPQSTSCNTLQAPCLSSNFDSSTSVPAGWGGGSGNDATSSHYSSANNCRSLGAGVNLSTPASNYPTAISFYVDASGSGGQIGTLEYSTSGSAGPWTFISNFTATTAGAINTVALTSSPNLSTTANVSFRITSASTTIYIDDLNVYCNTTPFITVTPSTLTAFTYVLGSGPSASQTFTVSGNNLTTSLTLTAPADYEISLTAGSGYGSSIILSPTGGVVSTTTIYVRLIAGLAVANYNSEVINASSTGATTQTVTCSGSVTNAAVSSITLANNGTQVTAASVAQGTANQILSTFTLAVSTVNATLSSVSVPFSGTYLASDIVASGLQLWYNSSNSFSGATSLGTATSSATGTGENIVFASLSQTITAGSTGYFWVTASISSSATIGKTIYVSSLATSNFTFSGAVSAAGSASTGGVQTISGPLPCLTESFTAGTLPSGWLQTTVIFTSNYADFSGNNGSLSMASLSYPSSLTFTLARTSNATVKSMFVEVSTTSQTTGFTTVATYDHSNTTSAGTTNCSVDLSAYSGLANVYVRFSKVSATTSYWHADDINVYCSSACTPPATPVGTISETATCGGNSTLSFSGTATAPIEYYWESSAGGISKTNNSLGNLTVSSSGSFYVRAFNSATGCWSSALNGPYAVTIGTAQAISTQPSNSTITDTSNTTFSVTTTGTVTAYQWQVNTGSGFVNLTNVAPYTNVTTATMTITGATLTMNGYIFQCVVSGVSPCANVTSNPATLTVTNQKPNNATSVITCYGNTSVALSWTASSGTVVPDGYLVFALQGATAPATASPNNASTYVANADFSLALAASPASLGKCVYKGSSLSTTITGLLNATNYSFSVVAYKGSTQTGWATGINVAGSWNVSNITITMPDVTALAATIESNQSTVSWTRPTPLACYEYLVVANQGAVVFTPTGDGSAYTANAAYSSSNQVVYKGTGSSAVVTGLTYGLSYCYKVYVRMGTEWSSGVTVCQTTNYCSSSGNTTYQTSVTNVTLNTINNTSAKPSGYSDYTAISTSIQQGVSYPLSMKVNTDGNYTVLAFAWIDFNHDGDFTDVGEALGMGSATNTANGLTTMSPLTFTVPLTASVGSTRMRIIATFDGDASPCNTGFDGEVEDYTVIITAACIPTHSVVSFAPQSGPTGTDVLITGTGFTASTSVKFNGIAASVVFVNSTSIIATVPSGSTTGVVTVTEGTCPTYTSTNFTQITQSGVCTSGNNLNNLIISEVYDSLAANSWYMELYNPTGSAINLDTAGADYKLVRYGDIGTTNGIRTVNISGVIAAGGIYLADLGSDSICGALGFNYTNKGNGINENDEVRLTKNDVTVDIVYCPNEKGYSILRNASATGPSSTFISSDWTTNSTESCANLGIVPFSSFSILPTVTVNPIDVSICGSSASFSVTATSVGALTYQWYFNSGVATGWTALAAGSLPGVAITGITATTLNLTGTISVYDKYQFYCQVISNGTCFVASDAAQLTITSTIWNGSVWSNGLPTLSKVAIINGLYNTTSNGDINACSVIVNAGFTATITPSEYFNIQNDLTVNAGGNLVVQSGGSLVMIDDNGVVTNSGTTQVQRTASNIRGFDYVYWSSPVVGQSVNTIYSSPVPGSSYKWAPLASNINSPLSSGIWQSASGTMAPGIGYIMRGSSSYGMAATNIASVFTGAVNNGIVPVTVSRGSNQIASSVGPGNGVTVTNLDDNMNLLGNPYPSALNAIDFLNANSSLNGYVYLWTHGTAPVSAINPFYGSYASNYNPNDYLAYNKLGAQTQNGFDGYIATGQGFFVAMVDGPGSPDPLASQTVLFNNSMRSKTYGNTQFYRTSSIVDERHRIWLDLVDSNNESARTLVGYAPEATLGLDRMYDAFKNIANEKNIYSLAENTSLIIQGRPTPFDENDQVPIGFNVMTGGTYTIAIAAVDGLFNGGQRIFLEDKALNIIHDLRQQPYVFTASAGKFDSRFILRYTDSALGTENFESIENNVIVAADGSHIKVKSENELIAAVAIYDVLGRTILETKNVGSKNFSTDKISAHRQPLIVKTTLVNHQVVSRKVIF